ncbi:unnamed protein product [Arctia plantaginis]|uniref:BZIP domain-containing protein n=1 Tax=Arctia plantaginis TaxID=874455 RepID=A0A8S1AZM3_ARCPL|nr:unnamed protein product [Arctia plantaginis]CAB3250490.1 unnamed protein product [Arctia plantaginis]
MRPITHRAKISLGAQEEFKKFYTKWLLKRSPVRVGATISEINIRSNQTPKDVVFSQTSLKTQTVLKVVNLDHLKSENNQQVIGSIEAASSSDGYSNAAPGSPVPTTSFTEVSLKSEPLYDSAMFHETDYEFFQELAPLYYVPEKEEVVQTIDSFTKTEEKAINIDTPHIPFSPQAWEQFDVNSPQPQSGFYNSTPLSPNDNFGQYDNNNLRHFPEVDRDTSIQNQESLLNIDSLTTAFGDSTSEIVNDMNSWQAAEQVEWPNTTDTHFNIIYTNNTMMPFINGDDSVDLICGTVVPGEVEFIDLVPPDRNMNKEQETRTVQVPVLSKRNEGLSVDVSVRAPAWSQDISTPVILNEVISLEKENSTDILDPPKTWQMKNTSTEAFTAFKTSPQVDYDPITPKSESHMESDNEDSKSYTSKRRRHDSEDSDKTYTPYTEQPPRKYKRRKPSVPIKDLILALESQPKARRGRPPKRRESTVSSVCSVDENSSFASTQEYKYRELRDKNNEASKRSRMNRRLKEEQMEELAVNLAEENKRLKVRVGVLEEMTKKLKNELMSAILKK